MAINILPGKSSDQLRLSNKEKRDVFAKEKAEHAIDLIEDIKSPKSQELLKNLKKTLSDRISTLVKEDSYCQGLLTVLGNLGAEIKIGKAMAKQMVEDELGMTQLT